MTVALVWCALALAALGHGFLWSGLVNRIHAWGGSRSVIKALTLLCAVAFFVIPLGIGWQTRNADLRAFNPFASDLPVQMYLGTCVFIGAASLFVKPWIEAHRCDPSVLRH